MARKDVVHVLRRFRELLRPGASLLDLQAIPPEPTVELRGEVVGVLEGGRLLEDALAAAGVVDSEVSAGLLLEDAVDDHDVLRHFATGRDLLDHFSTRDRSVSAAGVARLSRTLEPCVVRERCRVRALRIADSSH